MALYLYHVSQSENNDYDTFSDFVCAARSEDEARNTSPRGAGENPWGMFWASSPDAVSVKLIGKAVSDVERGVICASFHAG